jgi:tRNA (guanine-N7-)-methyltransferase
VRQKFNKHATDAFFSEHGVITTPKKIDIKMNSILEIGSGKGKFITDYAQNHPDTTCIAFEINRHVAYYIVLKVIELNLSNVIVIIDDAERLDAYIDNHKLEAIHLNFSDPWPKKKHHKRRLTYTTKLQLYKKLLKHQGKLIIKTDHQALYLDSIAYVQSVFQYVTYDEDAPLEAYVSEYELKKRPFGAIYKIIAEVKNEHL